MYRLSDRRAETHGGRVRINVRKKMGQIDRQADECFALFTADTTSVVIHVHWEHISDFSYFGNWRSYAKKKLIYGTLLVHFNDTDDCFQLHACWIIMLRNSKVCYPYILLQNNCHQHIIGLQYTSRTCKQSRSLSALCNRFQKEWKMATVFSCIHDNNKNTICPRSRSDRPY